MAANGAMGAPGALPSVFSLNILQAMSAIPADGIMYIPKPENQMVISQQESVHMSNSMMSLSIRLGETVFAHYLPGPMNHRPSIRVGPIRNATDARIVSRARLVMTHHHAAPVTPTFNSAQVQTQGQAQVQIQTQGQAQVQVQAQPVAPLAQVVSPIQPAAPGAPSAPSQDRVERVPKPRNSWILYRSSKHHQVLEEYPYITNAELSKMISRMWKQEPDEVKLYFGELAAEERLLHGLANPGWKCQPRKSSDIKRRMRKSALLAGLAPNGALVEIGFELDESPKTLDGNDY